MKIKIVAVLVVTGVLMGCGVSREARQIKLYQDQLGTMVGKNEADISAQIKKTWGFELLDSWTKENPDVETVLKNNYRIHGFSKNEAAAIFAEPGRYRVRIYLKFLSSEAIETENISELGRNLPESRRNLESKNYGYIRVVYRDDKLIYFDAWT